MLRYLLPSGAIVTVCVAIYGTSLKAPPTEDPLIVVPVVLEAPPSPPPPVRPLAHKSPSAPVGPVPPVAAAPPPALPPPVAVEAAAPAPARLEPAKPALLGETPPSQSRPVIVRAPVAEHRRPTRHYSAAVSNRAPHATHEQYSAAVSNPGPASPHELLQSAQAALAGNNASLVRGLLESAETAVVFQPGGYTQERTSVAAAQITQALRDLNNGDRALASQHVGQALAAVGFRP
jgi:hypothetical protein